MDNRELVLNNFLGLDLKLQQKIIKLLLSVFDERKNKKLAREFDDKFSEYYIKLERLIAFKDEYDKFNSNKRRLMRKIMLNEFEDIVYFHHHDYSEENTFQRFRYFSPEVLSFDREKENNRYFNPQVLSEDIVEDFIKKFNNLSIFDKFEFIEDMCFNYSRLAFFNMPVSKRIVVEYRDLIKMVLGDDLITYFDKLYPEEQMECILKSLSNLERYDSKEVINKNVEDLQIGKIKRKVINECENKFSKN